MARPVVVEGVGLHTGARCRVVLWPRPGPVSLGIGGVEAAVRDLAVVSTVRATTVQVRTGGPRISTVEHVFASLAALGVYRGLRLDVDGPEMPLIDGCASAWCEAIGRLRLPATRAGLRVTRAAVLEVGPSRFELAPLDGLEVSVRFEGDEPWLHGDAVWRGDADDFVARIAPARTFVLARDLDEMARHGLARHVDPACVVLVSPDGLLSAGRPASPDEPARHKLLDLVGDLYLEGGLAAGRFHAIRPGHTANARALQRALEAGVLAPC